MTIRFLSEPNLHSMECGSSYVFFLLMVRGRILYMFVRTKNERKKCRACFSCVMCIYIYHTRTHMHKHTNSIIYCVVCRESTENEINNWCMKGTLCFSIDVFCTNATNIPNTLAHTQTAHKITIDRNAIYSRTIRRFTNNILGKPFDSTAILIRYKWLSHLDAFTRASRFRIFHFGRK